MALSGDPGKPRPAARPRAPVHGQPARVRLAGRASTPSGRDRVAARDRLEGRRHDRHAHPRRGHHLLRRQPLHRDDVADNINFVGDPKNKSPSSACSCRPARPRRPTTRPARSRSRWPQPAPFVLNGLASLPMVCANGMKDRSRWRTAPTAPARTCSPRRSRATTTPTSPRRLHLGPGRRHDRERGHARHGRAEDRRRTRRTAANLLLSGEVNAAADLGPDAERLEKRRPVLRRDAARCSASSGTTTTTATRPATPLCGWRSPRRSTWPSSPGGSPPAAGKPATTLAGDRARSPCPGDSDLRRRPARPTDVDGRPRPALREGGKKLDRSSTTSASGQPAVAAAAELAVQQWEAARRRGRRRKRMDDDRAQRRHLRHRRLGHRLGPAQREQPRPARRRSSPARPAPTRAPTSPAIDNAGLHRRRDRGVGMDGTDGLRRPGSTPSRRCSAAADIVPFANSAVQTFGNGAEFELPRAAHADQHPDAGEVDRHGTHGELGRSAPDGATGGSGLRTRGCRFARPPARAAAGLAVGAGHGVVPDDPPDPGRPGAGGARPDRAGRAGRGRSARSSGLERPAVACSTGTTSSGLFTGDLGTSIVSRLPVSQVDRAAAARRRSSWRVLAFLVAVVVAVPLGVAMARADPARSAAGAPSSPSPRRAWCSARSPTSCSRSAWSTCSASASAGCRSPGSGGPGSYVLPVVALALGPAAILARIVRVEMLAVLRGRLRPHRPRQAAARPARSTWGTRCPTR